jgi:uncharacterized membrane protein YecN with MAPEG domain
MVTETPVIAAILLLLVTLLAAHVSALRIVRGISLGDGGDRRMFRAIRAHANALEHTLPFLLLLFFYELRVGPEAPIRELGGLFVAARLAHAVGMLWGPFNLRRLGATLTVALELWVALALLSAAL